MVHLSDCNSPLLHRPDRHLWPWDREKGLQSTSDHTREALPASVNGGWTQSHQRALLVFFQAWEYPEGNVLWMRMRYGLFFLVMLSQNYSACTTSEKELG